jgi:multicomponent Na+:H+ antiporter subunit D
VSSLIVLPILIPLFTGAACVVAWRFVTVQRVLTLSGAIAYFGVSVRLLEWVIRDGIQAEQMGNWAAPFGITLVADMFGALMVVTTGVVSLVIVVYSLGTIDRARESYGYYPLLNILLMGISGAFLTGDIFNLFVWFEVLLISSFVLLALGGERAQLEGAIKYVTLNLIASALFLAAVGILYAMAGSLNMADLSHRLATAGQPGLATTLAILFLAAFGIKGAIFPLFFWLPASYHTPPVAVSAIFGGLLTKVGVYALIRVFTLLFLGNVDYTHSIILVAGGITMVTGVLGAVAQYEFRRLLSFHIVSQIGYMIMGLGFFTPLALAGTVFFIIHNIVVKTNLFLVSGVSERIHGTYDLKKLGGLYRSHPWLSILFLISALSLAGVPPLSGFFGKLVLIRSGLDIEQFVVVAAALGVSLLTLFSMTKIWAEAFWKPLPADTPVNSDGSGLGLLLGPIVVLAVLAVVLGVAAEWFFDLALVAGEQLMDPREYIEAVLKVRESS